MRMRLMLGLTAILAAAPVLLLAADDVLFYAPFDGSAEAQVQRGETGVTVAVPPEFVKGFKGKALVTAHTRSAVYPAAGNIMLDEGTIVLWVMPMDWTGDQELFHHFFRVLAEPVPDRPKARVFDLILYRYLDTPAVMAYGLAGELACDGIRTVPMDESWAPGKWHQIAFTWDKEGATLYVDGVGSHRKYLQGPPDTMYARTFLVGGAYFMPNDTRTAVDELTIYRRKYAGEEIKQMYKQDILESLMRK